MNWQFLNKIWKPDTFFVNGKKSKMHKITVPNKFLRITPDGVVSYSQRLTIHARCRMHLRKFPLDSQICPLWIGSYGYASEDLIYEWRKSGGFSIDDLQMAQFLMVKYEQGVINNRTNRLIESGFRNDSVAYLHFLFERQTGFFLLQIYTPLLVIVMCSWVAFWIVKTDAPARCGLGITTVLSVTKIGFGGKGKPQVGYPTALDIFVVICLGSVFAALCEFAIMNFISVSVTRHKNQQKELKEAEEKAKELLDKAEKVMEKLNGGNSNRNIPEIVLAEENEKHNGLDQPIIMMDDENPFGDELEEGEVPIGNHVNHRKRSIETMDASTTTEDFKRHKMSLDLDEAMDKLRNVLFEGWQMLKNKPKWLRIKSFEEMYIYKNTEEALDYLDDCAKFMFPMGFLLMMLIYWISYLYIIEDKLEMDSF